MRHWRTIHMGVVIVETPILGLRKVVAEEFP